MDRVSKRIICAILSAVMLLTFLFCAPVTPSAAEDSGTRSVSIDITAKELWRDTSGVSVISERVASGESFISVSAKNDSDRVSFYAEFEPKDLSAYSEISVELTVKGEAESYPLTVSLEGGGEVFDHKINVKNGTSAVYIPLTEVVAPSLERIYFSIDVRSGPLSYVTITDILADDTYSYSYLSTFLAKDVFSDGRIEKSEDLVRILPENGECRAELEFINTEDYTSDQSILLWVRVNGIKQGTVTAVCEYGEKEGADPDENEVSSIETTPRPITADGSYFFVVRGGFTRVTFRFSALSDVGELALTGAGHSNMGVTEESAGSITDCHYNGTKVTVAGSLSSDASIEYYGSKLLLYAIPCRDVNGYDLKKYEPVASSGFTTKFSLSCNTDERYKEYFYKVVLDTKKGFVPVGGIVCADSTSAAPPASSAVSALYGADAADVFETNVSSVIIDVYAGMLIETVDIYSAEVYSYGTQYYFNRQYLSELDSEIQFFNSAGVQVYLRLYSDRDGYAFDYSPDDGDSLALMCAVGSFISERYPSVSGYIVGTPVNGDSGALSPEYGERKARQIAVFAETVRSKAPSAVVVLPFSSDGRSDSQLSLAMVYYYLAKYGAASTVILYESANYDEALSSRAAYHGTIPSSFSYATDGISVMWRVPEGLESADVTESYRLLCTDGAAIGMRFCALSLEKATKDTVLYDSLKEMLDSENVIPASISHFFASHETEDDEYSAFGIWDFTGAYDTAGWVSGGSFTAPVTARGQNGTRVLKAQSSDSTDGAGILIGKTEQSLDMSGVTARVTLTVLSEESEVADLDIIFGSGEARAEYSVKVKCNETSSLLCDMSAYTGASRIDYAAVIVRGVADATAEISKVELCSADLSGQELSERFSLSENEEHPPVLYAMIIFLAASSVAIFFSLTRKQRSGRRRSGK